MSLRPDLVPDILKGYPESLKVLNETLWDIKATSFSNLYRAQEVLAGIKRFDIKMSEFEQISTSRFVANINLEFITTKSRAKYRESKFYNKELTTTDIIENPDIFSSQPLVFINGKLYDNIFIKPNEDMTEIIININRMHKANQPDTYAKTAFSLKEMQTMAADGSIMTFLTIPTSQQTNRTNMNIRTVKNRTFIDQYRGIEMNVDFIRKNRIKQTPTFMMFMTDDDNKLYKYQLMQGTLSGEKYNLDIDQMSTFNNKKAHMKVYYFLNHLATVNLSKDETYFQLPIQDMPIPTESMLIFRKRENGTVEFDHDTKIEINYPNIYSVNKTHEDDLIIYVYYFDDTASTGTKYTNELALYHRFVTNVLDKYKDGSIPEMIKEYQAIKPVYDNNDLIDSDEFPSHLNYKLRVFRNLVKENGYFYGQYLDKFVGYIPSFYIRISELDDLDQRVRSNNKKEMKYTSDHVDFDEPCYLFVFRQDSVNDKMTIFLDNLCYFPKYDYSDKKNRYIYIPVRLIKPDSVIEIEKLFDSKWHQDITFGVEGDYIQIDIPENLNIKINDIFLTQVIDGKRTYINDTKYEFYYKRNGQLVKISNDLFVYAKTLYVHPTHGTIYNKDVRVTVNRHNEILRQYGSNTFFMGETINNDPRNVMMFKNGRHIPMDMMVTVYADQVEGTHTIKTNASVSKDDEFIMMHTNNKYSLIYSQKEIDESGYVNLTHKISKPISLKWYDIYVNGLKLHADNIDILTPYRFLIKGIPTRTNLEIYLKNLDTDFMATEDWTDDVSDRLIDEDKELEDKIIESGDKIEEDDDIWPDIYDDVIIDFIGFFDEWYDQIKLINPDLQQITYKMAALYIGVTDKNDNMFMRADTDYPMMSLLFNPDIDDIVEMGIT